MPFDPEQITFFAKTDARGVQVPFGIKAKDRTKHVYVIGKTGMGKSTLLENMAVQDIKNGNGLAFIDPHGATAEVLLEYIPEERVNDVLYFAPFDTQNPVSFNVMEDVGPDKRHLVVSGLMSVFKKIWVDAWSARMEYILSNTLLALLEYPDSTLLGVNRMLSDKHYRKKVVDNITDPAVKSFWVDEFANYNERYMQEAGDAIKNKIGQFTSNPLIRNIVGQPHSSFDIRQLMDERKILIANLSKGLVGESNANLLGSMLTTRIYLAAMSRADLSSEELKATPNFYFYVDEFQSFANATFADILSEARKYKLNLTIAHQYIEQMEEEVRNAVFGNVGTIIAFRVGPFDAEVLETVFTPKFLAADIVNLGFAQIYLSLMIDGIGSPPFSAATLPPITPPHISYKDMAIGESRRRYAVTRASVEERINAWHAEEHKPAGVSDEKVKAAGSSEKRPAKVRSSESFQETRRESKITTTRPEGREERRTSPRPKTMETKVPSRESADRSQTTPVVVSVPAPASTPAVVTRPERDLSELRSVLRSIADREGKSESTPKQSSSNTTAGAPRLDLKQALAAVIGDSVDNYAAKQLAPRDASVPTPKPDSHEVTPSVSATPGGPSTATWPSEPAYAEAKGRKALDPKTLERMLRVSHNDRNPLR